MIELLRQAWLRNPDMRLTQLLINAYDKPYECGLGLVYYIEDDVMENKLRSWAGLSRVPPQADQRNA